MSSVFTSCFTVAKETNMATAMIQDGGGVLALTLIVIWFRWFWIEASPPTREQGTL